MSARHRGGFTIIELMVSFALAFLLLAGAFEMHAAFSRQSVHQQQVSDMQQSLRVSAQVISRALRSAGSGMAGGYVDLWDNNANPKWWRLAAVQFSNNNAFPNNYPASTYDTAGGDKETPTYGGGVAQTNPDWIRAVGFDGSTGLAVDNFPATVAATAVSAAAATITVANMNAFHVGDFIFIYNGDYTSTTANHGVCVRQVTAVSATGTIGPAPDNVPQGLLTYAPTSPYNPPKWDGTQTFPPTSDLCIATLAATMARSGRPTVVFRFDRSVLFRVDVATDPRTPRLMAWYSDYAPNKNGTPVPNFYPEAQQNWKVLSENIEDMQVAAVLNNGTMCGTADNSVDICTDPNTPNCTGAGGVANCNAQLTKALRFTLVARSSSPLTGWTLGYAGGFEDETRLTGANSDGFVRRALTTEAEIRNGSWGAQ